MALRRQSRTSRRDFLKAATGLLLLPLINKIPRDRTNNRTLDKELPNLIILLFDALSAHHLSLYGYPRKTSPNIERFAQRATVYHNHHATANFTTPSTASLFTSTYPWEHRAYTIGGLIKPRFETENFFRLLGSHYFQAAFTQNINADMLLHQLDQYLDLHLPIDSYGFLGPAFYNKMSEDEAIANMKVYDQFLFKPEGIRASLFLSILNQLNYLLRYQLNSRKLHEIHPVGLPNLPGSYVHFLLDEVMDGVLELLAGFPTPFASYIHLIPPHFPYQPTSQFLGMFNDGWNPPSRKRHPLGEGVRANYPNKRQAYDEFIANLDAEFGRLLDHMQKTGLMDTSYLILTSDHGELFERGHRGHTTPMLFEPLIRVPMLISSPGQRERKDIDLLTSNLDLAPTLLHIAGLDTPETWAGQVLPGFSVKEASEREIWSFEAKANSTHGSIRKATLALIQRRYKLIYYHGYDNYQGQYELYDLINDPDELENIYPTHPMSKELQSRVDQKFFEIVGQNPTK